jgi:hypothetical protein
MGSQIKNEQSFNIVDVFTNLQQSRLKIEILDHLIFIIKNSPSMFVLVLNLQISLIFWLLRRI